VNHYAKKGIITQLDSVNEYEREPIPQSKLSGLAFIRLSVLVKSDLSNVVLIPQGKQIPRIDNIGVLTTK